MSDRSFYFTLDLSAFLSVDEIWPDGDAPESPTVEDVIGVVQKYAPLDSWIRQWNMTSGQRLLIDGHDSGLHG